MKRIILSSLLIICGFTQISIAMQPSDSLVEVLAAKKNNKPINYSSFSPDKIEKISNEIGILLQELGIIAQLQKAHGTSMNLNLMMAMQVAQKIGVSPRDLWEIASTVKKDMTNAMSAKTIAPVSQVPVVAQPVMPPAQAVAASSASDAFPKNEYDYWMNLIQQLNPLAYETLKKCEAANSKPCLRVIVDAIKDPTIKPGNKETHGYPTLGINPLIKSWSEKDRNNRLMEDLNWYESIARPRQSPTADQRKYVLEIIKELVPALHKELVAVDPTGANHMVIQESEEVNVNVVPPLKDGLPEFRVGTKALQLPKNELRFVVAHELGHHVLDHFKSPSTDKIVQLAFNRSQEFEADRFAVIELGIPIDDAIAFAKKMDSEVYKEYLLKAPEKETFKITHPLFKDRIKHFEELRREVELHKAQKRQPMQINWKELAKNYLKELPLRF